MVCAFFDSRGENMDWNRKDLDTMPAAERLIRKGDERIETYCEDTMMRGNPDAVLVARDEKEVAEALAFCHSKQISLTICGSQTSMTGASVPREGLLVSTEKLEGVTDISTHGDETIAVVRPGTVIADLQRTVAEAGFYYPVAPTSRDECRIGANVATNATGEDSYKYGPVRRYVQSLEIVLPDGSKRMLERKAGEDICVERNRAGYFAEWKNPIDLIIGSEGTLCFVSKVRLRLLHKSPSFFSALIPVSSNRLALEFVIDVALNRKNPNPRTLELIDQGALAHMKTAEGIPSLPEEAKAFLYIKQEYANEEEMNRRLEQWYEAALKFTEQELADQILIATTTKQQEDFRLWRHRVPESANELGRTYWANGGGKVGSDWWVPMNRLMEMMEHFYRVADATGLPYMGYAHIGSGHPHTNLLARDPKEKAKAIEVLTSCCRKAVELGGGVAGEHGIGKLHTDLMPIQHSSQVIEQMRAWKTEYDPYWILGRGNIFEV